MFPVDPNIRELTPVVYAKDQPEYLPLPARKDDNGVIVTLWKLSWRERIQLLLAGKFYLTVMTFNQPLQPVSLTLDKPKLQ